MTVSLDKKMIYSTITPLTIPSCPGLLVIFALPSVSGYDCALGQDITPDVVLVGRVSDLGSHLDFLWTCRS